MTKQAEYLKRFMLHTELYMSMSGKRARDLERSDLDRISLHIATQKNAESNRHRSYDASTHAVIAGKPYTG